MRNGRRVRPAQSLQDIRAYTASQLARLPEPVRRLEPYAYPVEIERRLQDLAAELDRHDRSGQDTL
jgi:nicotinate phosphoribosyltransferase